MIRINLLPYRAERRQTQILQHIAALLIVVVTASLGVFVADLYKTSELTALEDEFSDIKAQNDVLRVKIGKIKDLDKLREDVERKLALVDQLQEGRFYSLSTFSDLASLMPENVWLNDIKDSNSNLTINGMGESNKAVANFMRALDESPEFTNINLKTISRINVGSIPVRKFGLTLTRVVKTEPKSEPIKGRRK